MKISQINSNGSFITSNLAEGVLWLPLFQKEEVHTKVNKLTSKHVHKIRVGIDCEAFNAPGGAEWYDWLIPYLGDKFELTLTFDYGSCIKDSKPHSDYTFFEIIEHFTMVHMIYFNTIELRRKQGFNPNSQPIHNLLSDPLVFSATWANTHGKKVILGNIGMGDMEWISTLISTRLIDYFDYLEINRDEDFYWNENSNLYEEALQKLIKEKGCKTNIRFSAKPFINLQILQQEKAS